MSMRVRVITATVLLAVASLLLVVGLIDPLEGGLGLLAATVLLIVVRLLSKVTNPEARLDSRYHRHRVGGDDSDAGGIRDICRAGRRYCRQSPRRRGGRVAVGLPRRRSGRGRRRGGVPRAARPCRARTDRTRRGLSRPLTTLASARSRSCDRLAVGNGDSTRGCGNPTLVPGLPTGGSARSASITRSAASPLRT